MNITIHTTLTTVLSANSNKLTHTSIATITPTAVTTSQVAKYLIAAIKSTTIS